MLDPIIMTGHESSIKHMRVSGTINNQCFLFTLINKMKYFNVTHLRSTFIYTDKFNQ